ncbi:MAG: PIG-L family deacetylase [bacterium]|nr:PIG-L family deacetylase [bacterium]
MRRVLVVAAHADDDVLGCGATMARLASEGAAVRVEFLSDGVASRDMQPQDAAARRADAVRALAALGVDEVEFGEFPDNAMDTVSRLDVCKRVSQTVEQFEPDTVLTHSVTDLNVDHRITAEAALVASRPQPGSPVRRVLNFEVPSSTGWRPSGDRFDPRFHMDVTDFVAAKLAALHEYDIEMRPWPHARSYEAVEALMRWRGSAVGVEAAESYEVSLWLEAR